jgi:hypothetical protein
MLLNFQEVEPSVSAFLLRAPALADSLQGKATYSFAPGLE